VFTEKELLMRIRHRINKMFTKTHVKILLILLDDYGHPEGELSEYLEMRDSNLNPILKRLSKMELIYQGQPRKSTRIAKKDKEK
jgi:DNA-binding MarR family transcriptional regulator